MESYFEEVVQNFKLKKDGGAYKITHLHPYFLPFVSFYTTAIFDPPENMGSNTSIRVTLQLERGQ